jgi:D-sedoheptulose 7-phosphate isomerase
MTQPQHHPRQACDGAASIAGYLEAVGQVLRHLPADAALQTAAVLHHARAHGRSVFVLGNGGSAATALHFACDLGKGTMRPHAPRIRALALTENLPLVSAWANDFGYDQVFSQQLAGLARAGDVVIAFSGSGNSPNVIQAIRTARALGAITVAFTGFDGGLLKDLVDICLLVPSSCMEQVEDAHLVLEHAVSVALGDMAEACSPTRTGAAKPAGARAPAPSGSRAAVFLDRDGVINRNRSDYVKSWDEFSFLPGATEALSLLSQAALDVVVVSNQSAINRGLVDETAVREINSRMVSDVERAGGRIDEVLFCPHRPDEGCACRKPNVGLLEEAARARGIDLSRSYMIGDSRDDVAAGLAAGCHTVLVLTGLGARHLSDLASDVTKFYVAADLRSAATWILGQEGHSIETGTGMADGPA